MTRKRPIITACQAVLLSAFFGFVAGILTLIVLTPEGFGAIEPPVPRFTGDQWHRELFLAFGKEALPPVLALLAAHCVKHPLPILLAVARRAFLLGLSSAYLAAYQGLTPVYAVYTLLGTALTLCSVAAAIACLSHIPDKKLPFLYFMGLLFLLTVIRLLAFTLIL